MENPRAGRAVWYFGVPIWIALLTVSVPFASNAQAKETTCTAASSPEYLPADDAATVLRPKDQRTTAPPPVDLGASRSNVRLAPYTYSINGPAPGLKKLSWDLTLVDGNRQFPDNQVGVAFSNVLKDLRVSLCLIARNVPPGSYAGSLTIAGDTVEPVQLPITVNLKDNDYEVIWAGLAIASLLAVFVKWWMVRLADSAQSNYPSIGAFIKWIREQYVTVVISVVGAAGLVYQTKYLGIASFTSGQRWALWSATFTAVTTASLLLTSIGKAVKDPVPAGPAPRDPE